MKENEKIVEVEEEEVEITEVTEAPVETSKKGKIFRVSKKFVDLTVKTVGVLTIVGAAIVGGAFILDRDHDEEDALDLVDLKPDDYDIKDDVKEEG